MGSILPPETMSMFMVNVAAKGCVDVCGVCYHQGTMLISIVHAASNAMHARIHDPAAYVDDMLMSMAQANTKGHDGVCDLCCSQTPCEGP